MADEQPTAPIRPTRYQGHEVRAAHYVSQAVLMSMALPRAGTSMVILKKLQRELEDAGLDPADYECVSTAEVIEGGAWFLLIERTPPRQETPCDE